MPWTFEITAGKFHSPSMDRVWDAYAGGDCGKHPEGRNNAAMCSVHDIGPLPEGLYTMEAPIEHSQLGPFAIPLTPDPANEMFGRRGFFLHGDKIGAPGSASDGCIVVPREARDAAHASPDQIIRVSL